MRIILSIARWELSRMRELNKPKTLPERKVATLLDVILSNLSARDSCCTINANYCSQERTVVSKGTLEDMAFGNGRGATRRPQLIARGKCRKGGFKNDE